ncbi:hypothetical protein Nepgr_002628 [Nepenthes gracilis]|uniref:Uncharacterized protein n=1 Tax=Nepenthes gracilis TaxID=150966 RepID=A0AAD3P9V7_NEPGR|nr:hypothetical protein Nepgr_002628 [Nepenthes gracilis]
MHQRNGRGSCGALLLAAIALWLWWVFSFCGYMSRDATVAEGCWFGVQSLNAVDVDALADPTAVFLADGYAVLCHPNQHRLITSAKNIFSRLCTAPAAKKAASSLSIPCNRTEVSMKKQGNRHQLAFQHKDRISHHSNISWSKTGNIRNQVSTSSKILRQWDLYAIRGPFQHRNAAAFSSNSRDFWT